MLRVLENIYVTILNGTENKGGGYNVMEATPVHTINKDFLKMTLPYKLFQLTNHQ
jgi:hypothetical protein